MGSNGGHEEARGRTKLFAVILAAGASRRMGSPKALLEIGGKSFLRHIVDTLASAGMDDVVVVLGAEAERIRGNMDWFGGMIAVNINWEEGQLSSIVTGLNALGPRRVPGVMVCPVDHPLLSKELVLGLLVAYEKTKKKIVVPVFNGRRGHPVVFDASLFDELRRAPHELGARAVVRAHPDDVEEVPTTERGVSIDIATMRDYEKEILRVER